MYEKQSFQPGQVLTAERMNTLEEGIFSNQYRCFYVFKKDENCSSNITFAELYTLLQDKIFDECPHLFGIFIDYDNHIIDILNCEYISEDFISFSFMGNWSADNMHNDSIVFYPDCSIIYESADGGIGGWE